MYIHGFKLHPDGKIQFVIYDNFVDEGDVLSFNTAEMVLINKQSNIII